MNKNNLIEKAAKIATLSHAGQMRRDKETPYIVHPFMAAFILAKYDFPDTVIAAALVHDVLEDTDFREEQLRQELGGDVVDIVKSVSENMSLPWDDRKKAYIEKVGKSSEGVKAVSIADKIHNFQNILNTYDEIGPEVWKNFNRGKEHQVSLVNNLFNMYKETWDHPLVDKYEVIVKRFNELE